MVLRDYAKNETAREDYRLGHPHACAMARSFGYGIPRVPLGVCPEQPVKQRLGDSGHTSAGRLYGAGLPGRAATPAVRSVEVFNVPEPKSASRCRHWGSEKISSARLYGFLSCSWRPSQASHDSLLPMPVRTKVGHGRGLCCQRQVRPSYWIGSGAEAVEGDRASGALPRPCWRQR